MTQEEEKKKFRRMLIPASLSSYFSRLPERKRGKKSLVVLACDGGLGNTILESSCKILRKRFVDNVFLGSGRVASSAYFKEVIELGVTVVLWNHCSLSSLLLFEVLNDLNLLSFLAELSFTLV